MSRLSVLHLISSFGGGGAERQLVYLANGLARKGVNVHVGHLYGGPNIERIEHGSVAVHQLAAYGNHDPLLLVRTAALIKQHEIDLVQTWLPQMDVLGGLAARWVGVPWVLSERSSGFQLDMGGWKARLRQLVARTAAAVVANSEVGKRSWMRFVSGDRVRVIRNAIPLNEIANDDVTACLPSITKPVGRLIAVAGRFTEYKNLFTVLSALEHVMEKRADVQAVFLGGGPLHNDVQAKARSMHSTASRIQFPGYSDHLWAWLKSSSLYVSVSRHEGNPNIVLEAAACGCPMVLSNIPAHRELFSEREAIFVETDSPDDIAAGILFALGNDESRASMARAAQKVVQQWTIESATGKYLELYQTLLEQRLKPDHQSVISSSH